jgi:hypothetical protein
VYRDEKEAYMGNQIARMGVLNHFEALNNWYLNVIITS